MKNIIFLTVCFLMFSCTTELTVATSIVIENQTEHIVTFTVYGPHKTIETFELNSGEEAIKTKVNIGVANIPPLSADSVHIFYDDTHTQRYHRTSASISIKDHNPFNIESYEKISVKESNKSVKDIYTYIITEKDFKSSIIIE